VLDSLAFGFEEIFSFLLLEDFITSADLTFYFAL